jgi:hypothetical protein
VQGPDSSAARASCALWGVADTRLKTACCVQCGMVAWKEPEAFAAQTARRCWRCSQGMPTHDTYSHPAQHRTAHLGLALVVVLPHLWRLVLVEALGQRQAVRHARDERQPHLRQGFRGTARRTGCEHCRAAHVGGACRERVRAP